MSRSDVLCNTVVTQKKKSIFQTETINENKKRSFCSKVTNYALVLGNTNCFK